MAGRAVGGPLLAVARRWEQTVGVAGVARLQVRRRGGAVLGVVAMAALGLGACQSTPTDGGGTGANAAPPGASTGQGSAATTTPSGGTGTGSAATPSGGGSGGGGSGGPSGVDAPCQSSQLA